MKKHANGFLIASLFLGSLAALSVKTGWGYISQKESQEAMISQFEARAAGVFEDYQMGEYDYAAKASKEILCNLNKFRTSIPARSFFADASRIEQLSTELQMMSRASEFFRDNPAYKTL